MMTSLATAPKPPTSNIPSPNSRPFAERLGTLTYEVAHEVDPLIGRAHTTTKQIEVPFGPLGGHLQHPLMWQEGPRSPNTSFDVALEQAARVSRTNGNTTAVVAPGDGMIWTTQINNLHAPFGQKERSRMIEPNDATFGPYPTPVPKQTGQLEAPARTVASSVNAVRVERTNPALLALVSGGSWIDYRTNAAANAGVQQLP